jgi:Rrf2 family protein
VAAIMRLELSRRGDYAVRAMLALAAYSGEPGRISARRLADLMAIPSRFLPHVLRDLSQAGLVEGRIGRSGGYRLAREPARITLLEIVEAAEGDGGQPTCVLRGGPCRPDGRCAVHDPFAATTLGDVPMDWETFGPRAR